MPQRSVGCPLGFSFHPDVTRDAALIQPLQQFAVAVGGIRGQSLGQVAVTFAIALNHVSGRFALVTQPCRRSLPGYDSCRGKSNPTIPL